MEQEQEPTPQPMNPQAHFYNRLNHVYDEYFLTALQRAGLTTFLTHHFAKENTEIRHIQPWLLAKMNNKRIPPENPLQKGCCDVIPGLRSQPWWDSTHFPWLKQVEDNYEMIKEQVLALRCKKGFQPYRGPSWIKGQKAEDGVGYESVDSGAWNVYYLQLHNMRFDSNCAELPRTMQLLHRVVPNCYHHSFVSALTHKSHITAHWGPTNKKLRLHLPLVGVKGSRLRVGEEVRVQEAGKAYVFDDSFNHEAWHEGEETRVILIADFWHPDLTPLELKFLKVLQNALFKAQQLISTEDKTHDNYYSIIEDAKYLLKSNQWWTVAQGKEQEIPKEQIQNNEQLQNNEEIKNKINREQIQNVQRKEQKEGMMRRDLKQNKSQNEMKNQQIQQGQQKLLKK